MVSTVSSEKGTELGVNTLKERRTFKISMGKFKIKPTLAGFHFHSCSAKWFHIAWNTNQAFSGLPCLPLDCPSFFQVLSPLMLLLCLKHWLLCFSWPKWKQDSHFFILPLLTYLDFYLDYLNFYILLASTTSNDLIAGGGIYSEELRASKNTPKHTKIVPITFYSLAKGY